MSVGTDHLGVDVIEQWLEYWAKNIHRLDLDSVNRECGVRKHGIEYRIMLEGGVASPASSLVLPDQLLSDIDLAVSRIARSHPMEMAAVREYYKRGSYRAVRLALEVGGVQSRSLVKHGELMITGALSILF